MSENKRTYSPPWMFALTSIPFGVVGGFCGITMPYLARTRGHVEMESIGWFVLVTFFPPIVQFLYAPIVDIGPKRKHWLLIVTLAGAACVCAALMMPLPSRLTEFVAFSVAAQAISGLIGSCNGGILATTMPDSERGKAGGWLNAGNLGGGAIATYVAIVMTQHEARPLVLGLTVAAMMFVPALAALFLIEPARPRRSAREIFGSMIHDVGAVIRSRQGWTGILFCLSPVGTAALVNAFSGMAKDFNIGEKDPAVAWVNGAVGAVLTIVGSLAGGWICDRVNRRHAYLAAGLLTAMCAFGMMDFPLSRTNYIVGVCAYQLVAGFCYAAFSAVVLEAIGKAGHAASTQYTLFTSAGNAAIAYVGWLDTRFNHVYGPKAPLAADGALNLIGIGLLGLMMWRLLSSKVEPRPAARDA